ncbi:MAG: hypothetical protein HKP58_04020 [Desulfatitalea sp.]|nr:rod-binding protein [Desulfatitalea sp.]NNJ99560.1 hypothetical protein [Desulfatitalea sp.]
MMGDPIDTNGRVAQLTTQIFSARREGTGNTSESKKLDQACKDFESLFINHMLSEMRKTVPQEGLFGGGQAERLYTSMLDSETAKAISSQRGIGLAPVLYRQMAGLLDVAE